MSLLAFDRVTKTYRRGGFPRRAERIVVLDGVDLAIRTGECVGLLGRSGSGKSTLGRLALGLEQPDAGAVRYRGKTLTGFRGRAGREARRALQVVFQDSIGAVDPRHSVRAIVGEPLVNFDGLRGGALDTRVVELLVSVGLDPGDADKLPGQMSGGQLQRVCVARAIAPRPALVVLDEAVSNLDVTVQARVLDLLAAIRRAEGTAYLFITHDIRLALRFCDRIVVLHDGRIVDEAPAGPTAVFTHPAARDLAAAALPALPRAARIPRGAWNPCGTAAAR